MIGSYNHPVSIHYTPTEQPYPTEPPFHPPAAFPEYPFQTGLHPDNFVYQAVRDTFRQLGLDQANFGRSDWNPLGDLIRPGDQVLIKPNMVLHYNGYGHDPRSVVTHASVTRAVIDYVYLALRGRGKIIVGDAPLQSGQMDKILALSGLDSVLNFYAGQPDVDLEFMDFRLVQSAKRGSIPVQRQALIGAEGGYQAIDLAQKSYLNEISDSYPLYRVTDYDMGQMTQHHNSQTNEYLIPTVIIESDVVLNLPKLKTHRKVGLTVSLKNLVGINGHKDWLPHHRYDSVAGGGDEYLHPSWRKRLDTFFEEQIDVASQTWQKYMFWLGHAAVKISGKIIPFPDPYLEGSWWGNDTLWRTVLDLNRILFYADKQGRLTDTPQRRYLSVVDGIMAGEGEGPLEPTPKICGLIICGFNPALVDHVCARLMGFDSAKIPLIRSALADPHFVQSDQLQTLKIVANEPRFENVLNWQRDQSLAFIPARGWTGHIELNELDSVVDAMKTVP